MMRSKILVVSDFDGKLKNCPKWAFDGSSTEQASGVDNDQRLTGRHETQSIDKFSYGISDRGASIRIPISTIEKGWKGRLEDRRPASNADPYKVAARIIQTVKSVEVDCVKLERQMSA